MKSCARTVTLDNLAGALLQILRPGGIGVLHHGTVGGQSGGWRSNMTAEGMIEVLQNAGLEIIDQFREWSDGGREFQAGLYNDAITVFRKPA